MQRNPSTNPFVFESRPDRIAALLAPKSTRPVPALPEGDNDSDSEADACGWEASGIDWEEEDSIYPAKGRDCPVIAVILPVFVFAIACCVAFAWWWVRTGH